MTPQGTWQILAAWVALLIAVDAFAEGRTTSAFQIVPDASGYSGRMLDLPEHSGVLVLHLKTPYVDRYVLRSAPDTVLFEGGSRMSGDSRVILHPEFAVPLSPDLPRKLHLEVWAQAEAPIAVDLRDARSWHRDASRRLLLDGVYFGSTFLMTLLAGGLALFARDPHSFRLAVALAVWSVTNACARGYGGLFLWPDTPELNGATAWLVVLASLATAWFSKGFLAEGVLAKVTRRALDLMMILAAVVLIVGIVQPVDAAAVWVLGITGLVILAGSIHAALGRDTPAIFLLAGTALGASPSVVFLLVPEYLNVTTLTSSGSLVLIVLAVLHRFGLRTRSSVMENEIARARGRFLANLSHEMRTPLNAIVGYSELCTSADLKGEAKSLVGRIDRSARLLLQIVNDVLDFSKLEAGKLEVTLAPTDFREIVADVVSTVEPRAQTAEVTIHVDIADTVPRAILADGGRCTQVLLNLVTNAVKFTHGGDVTIRARVNVRDEMLFFTVIDTGIGIEAEALPRLFNPYAQATSVHADSGTGLGLAISRDLAVLMGGDIEVDSEVGKGSVFTFRLPFSEPLVPEHEAAGRTALAAGNVLVAEDNLVNRMLIRRMLEREGQAVDVVDNGQEAVRRIAEGQYDLVLMDMNMPVLDGVNATRAIRSAEQGKRTPIVAMTGNSTRADRERCVDAGMDDYVLKPLTRDTLNGVLSRYVGADEDVPFTNH